MLLYSEFIDHIWFQLYISFNVYNLSALTFKRYMRTFLLYINYRDKWLSKELFKGSITVSISTDQRNLNMLWESNFWFTMQDKSISMIKFFLVKPLIRLIWQSPIVLKLKTWHNKLFVNRFQMVSNLPSLQMYLQYWRSTHFNHQ